MSGLSSSALQNHLQRYGSRSSAGDGEDCSDASETGRGSVEHPISQVKASEEEPSFLSMVFEDGTSIRGTIADSVRFTAYLPVYLLGFPSLGPIKLCVDMYEGNFVCVVIVLYAIPRKIYPRDVTSCYLPLVHSAPSTGPR